MHTTSLHSVFHLYKMRSYPSTIKREALSLLTDGLTHQQVANRFNIGRTTITSWAKGLREDALLGAERPKVGRRRKLTDSDAYNIKLKIRRGITKDALQATEALNMEKDDPVSVDTVRRALQRVGGHAKRKKKRPRLSKANRAARMDFAKKHAEWMEDDWSRVVWTDETVIKRIRADGGRYVWVFDDKPKTLKNKHVVDEARVVGTAKFGGGGIFIWSCMTWEGPGFLVKIQGGLDADLYISILKDDLMETLRDYSIDPNRFILQQDNDSRHTAKKTMDYLASVGLTTDKERLLPWPAQSSDLNPIEHLWKEVNDRLGEYPEPPKGMIELWERLTHEWYNIDKETCRNLIRSMPNRIQAVVDAKGGHTTY